MVTKPKNSDGGKRTARQSRSPEARIKGFTVEQQLQRLSAWQQVIELRSRPSAATPPEHLVDQWELLEAADPSIKASASFILRGSTHDNKPPLAQLFEYVEAGFYPPPDLVLTVLDSWRRYCVAASADELTLEEAFFGKPKPKAGNYAAQALKKKKDLGAAFQLGEHIKQGKSKEEAAALIANQYGGSEESIKKIKAIDPDGWRDQEK
jgi:hypothetical protein